MENYSNKRKNLETKHNIFINYLKNNREEIKNYGGMILLGTTILAGYCLYQNSAEVEKERYRYITSTVLSEGSNYAVKDLFLIQNDDNIYFCNKKLEISDEYVYVDIKTGDIICRDNENDVFIKKLSDIELQDIFKSYDYQMSIDQLNQEITYNFSLDNKQKTL